MCVSLMKAWVGAVIPAGWKEVQKHSPQVAVGGPLIILVRHVCWADSLGRFW